LKEGAFHPFYFLLPIFDTKLRWLFPARVQLHKDLETFLSKINDVIIEKRALIANNGGIDSLDENEKDLCTLMIEAEQGEGGTLTNEEMMV
jgi:cytochrome P450